MAGSKTIEQSPPLTASDAAEHTKRSNTPALLVRRPSLGSKFPEAVSSAYVLDWEGESCKQRLLGRAEDLLGEAVGRRRLTIIQGLPLDLVQVLRDSLGVSAGFIEAHAGRRQYRPSRPDNDYSFVSFEYPELVKVCRTAALGPDLGYKPSARQSDLVDVMDEAPFHSMSGDGTGVIFCHASLWMSSKADVLFLDRPIWLDPSSQLMKARRPLSVSRSWQTKIDESQVDGTSVWNVLIAEGDELPGLEDSLLRSFRHKSVAREAIPGVLCDAVYDKWLDFFENAPPHPHSGPLYDATLYWQATESLEQNFDLARDPERHPIMSDVRQPDWRHLLDRLQRRVAFSRLGLSTTNLRTPLLPPTTRAATTAPPHTREMGMSENETGAYPDAEGKWTNQNDGNQRALDRVTYLGGILLPFTVVSAILSMNDEYAPNAPHFWVFWAASIGAAMLCLLVIYLDQLRCLEVYFEVAATDTIESIFSSGRTHNGTALMPTSRGNVRLPSRFRKEMFVDMPQPGAGDMEVMTDSAVNPTMVVEQCRDGTRPKAWQRGRLGWGGAFKKIVGYYRWRGGMPVQISPYGPERFKMETI